MLPDVKSISISMTSKTFWEIKELISFSKQKFHFSGAGDFVTDDMDRG